MGWKQKTGLVIAGVFLLASCGGKGNGPVQAAAPAESQKQKDEDFPPDQAALNRSLEEIAELERSGSFGQGMALAESALRENAGDYAGAVIAAYKELAWAYGLGIIPREALIQGIENVYALREGGMSGAALQAAGGILAFEHEDWAGAEGILSGLIGDSAEIDGFARWMLLVCALQQNRDSPQAAETYRAIRARYAQFPEYWYRGARFFSGAAAANYAERCVGLAPEGPFAAECRGILAAFAGLKKEDGPSLKTRTEIEAVISRSVSQGNPEMLAALIPLISLPDNPYTVYAVGALRALSAAPLFRDFFSVRAASAKGRLAERLSYICRG
jgi:hypothetical protein